MGIYDRDYYRNEGPSFLGSITSTTQVCTWLIVINVAVFFVQMMDLRGAFGPPLAFTRAFDLTTGLAPRAADGQAGVGVSKSHGAILALAFRAAL